MSIAYFRFSKIRTFIGNIHTKKAGIIGQVGWLFHGLDPIEKSSMGFP